ncbi:MAG: ankyrin repeat domain-containing protein [Colwellia sp.]|nr:ankyrin repeat domain-containing protein [Colwellia sp.]
MSKSVKILLIILCLTVVVVISYNKISVTDKIFVQLLLNHDGYREKPIADTTKEQQKNLSLIQTNPPRSWRVCQNYLIAIDNMPEWREDRKIEIQHYFQEMYNQNIAPEMIDLISEFTGIGFLHGRILSHKKTVEQRTKFVAWLAEKDAKRMSNEESERFNNLLDKKDIEGLKVALLTKKLSTRKYLYRKGKTQTPIAYILKEWPNRGVEVVTELIVKGEKPSFRDVLMATKLGLPVSLISLMVDNSTIDPTRVFYQTGVYNSFTMVALEAKSPDLVDYWLSLGSPAIPDYFLKSALDDLKLFNDVDQKNVALDIFNILMKYNVKATDKETIKKLLNWLPQKSIEKYQTSFSEIAKAPMLKKWQTPVVKISATLFGVVLKGLIRNPSDDEFNNHCFSVEGRRLLNLALKPIKKENDPLLANVKNEENLYRNYNNEAKILLAEFNFDVITIEEAIEILTQSENLAAKLTINMLKNKKLKKLYKSLQKEQLNVDGKEIIDDIYRTENNGDWESINEKLDALLENNDSSLDEEKISASLTVKLMTALTTNQPFYVIQSLLNDGAILPDNAMMFLIRNDNNVEKINRLISYGLNIGILDPLGRNMIYYAVRYRSLNILKFLVNHGVPVNAPNYGLDPLDQALFKVKLFDMLPIIKVLIEAGASIKYSHKQQVLNISVLKPDVYQQLITSFPQLRI